MRFSIITCIIHWSWIWREGFPEGVIQLRHPIFLRYYCRVVPIYFTFQEPSSKPNSQPISHGSGVLASFKHIHKNLRCSNTWTWKFFLQSESNKFFAQKMTYNLWDLCHAKTFWSDVMLHSMKPATLSLKKRTSITKENVRPETKGSSINHVTGGGILEKTSRKRHKGGEGRRFLKPTANVLSFAFSQWI